MKMFSLVGLLVCFANHAAAMGFECVSLDPQATVIAATSGHPETLTIEYKGTATYRSIPVVASYVDGVNTFQSPGFENENDAPASLYVKIYRQNGKLHFVFSEGSYLPVVPFLDGECRQI